MHNSIGIISREMFCLELPSQAHLFPLFSCFSKFYNDEHCNIIHYLQDCLLTLLSIHTQNHMQLITNISFNTYNTGPGCSQAG